MRAYNKNVLPKGLKQVLRQHTRSSHSVFPCRPALQCGPTRITFWKQWFRESLLINELFPSVLHLPVSPHCNVGYKNKVSETTVQRVAPDKWAVPQRLASPCKPALQCGHTTNISQKLPELRMAHPGNDSLKEFKKGRFTWNLNRIIRREALLGLNPCISLGCMRVICVFHVKLARMG
jgi:hypothetical protein